MGYELLRRRFQRYLVIEELDVVPYFNAGNHRKFKVSSKPAATRDPFNTERWKFVKNFHIIDLSDGTVSSNPCERKVSASWSQPQLSCISNHR